MKIAIIGGINIDIEGAPFKEIKYHDSNPGKIRLSYGGVGRNIAENTARLGGDCAMISVVGDEPMSKGAVTYLHDLGVDVSHVRVIPGETPSMYLSILFFIPFFSTEYGNPISLGAGPGFASMTAGSSSLAEELSE